MMRDSQVRVARGFGKDFETLLSHLVDDADDTMTKGRAKAARENVRDALEELEAIETQEEADAAL